MTKDGVFFFFYISSNSLPEGEKSVEAEWADEGWMCVDFTGGENKGEKINEENVIAESRNLLLLLLHPKLFSTPRRRPGRGPRTKTTAGGGTCQVRPRTSWVLKL